MRTSTHPKELSAKGCSLHHYPILLIYFFILLQFSGASQMQFNLRINYDDSTKLVKYQPGFNEFEYKSIPLAAGDYRIEDPAIAILLNNETITGVDLVYTDYPPGEDLRELNRKRLLELYMYCPNAFNHRSIRWRVVKQSGAKTQSDLRKYFHGFVIYYRPVIPFNEERDYFSGVMKGTASFTDSTLLKVFARNTNWKDMLCVVDVTGSMSPFNAQLLYWLKFNEQRKTFRQFVFFNDDDELSNDQKLRTDTVGYWHMESYKAQDLMKKMLVSMQNGGQTETNLEAIFYAVKKFPGNIKNIVMIADNWQDPYDMYLLPKLKALNIPIRIIICGVEDIINPNYLEIAYATNGSVHTMEEDLIELGKLSQGKVITLSGMRYKLIGTKFFEVH